jgi:chemotaxis methyl-accepting protein methylase
MPYLHTLPVSISFRGKGLFGYSFGPLLQKDLEVLYIESETGHDTFMVLRGVTRIYYVLAGSGSFTIAGREHNVSAGVLVEIPADVEYTYSGRMTMLAFCKRGWFSRRDKFTRWNRDVVGEVGPWSLNRASWLTRLVRLRIFGKSLTNAFLRVNRPIWNVLPSSLVQLRPLTLYGRFLHALVRRQGNRAQALSTFFLRNRPQLDLIRRLVSSKKSGDTVRLAVLGCSTGAEVYSIIWAIRTARPDLRLVIQAVDVSKEAVEFARRGVYPLHAKMVLNNVRDCMAAGRWRVSEGSDVVDAEIFERMTGAEKAEFFDLTEGAAAIKDWLKEGITWCVADVREPELLDRIGYQDMVIASNFLCHMEDSEADRCLRNIARLVRPEGYLFVSGIDLDIRERVAQELGWEPVSELLEEIHDGDPCLRGQWPLQYAGLEPLDTARPDWKVRYATAFRIDSTARARRLPYNRAVPEERIETRSTAV